MKPNTDVISCPMMAAMNQIGGKWKLLLVYYLADGTKRFSQLQKALPNITAKMLSSQLKELEKDQIVNRHFFAVIPPKVEYSLTEKGQQLLPVISQLSDWGTT